MKDNLVKKLKLEKEKKKKQKEAADRRAFLLEKQHEKQQGVI